MAKKQKDSELEHLRSENKTMKAQIRNLKKEVARKTKREHLYQDNESKEAEEMLKDTQSENKFLRKDICPECGKKVDIIELGTLRKIYECTSCTYRAVKKN